MLRIHVGVGVQTLPNELSQMPIGERYTRHAFQGHGASLVGELNDNVNGPRT
jgi:hypothetical protein